MVTSTPMTITLPTDWAGSLGSGAQEIVTSLFPVILFLGAIALGFYLVNKILSLVTVHYRGRGRRGI